MTSNRRFTLFLLSILLLSACGQKGALYLPGDASEVRTEVPATGTSTTAEDETDEESASDEQP